MEAFLLDAETRFPHLIRAILARPWAIDRDSIAWAAIMEVLALRAASQVLSLDEIEARLAAAQNGPRAGSNGRPRGNVALIPVYGVISPRTSMFARASGGTSAEAIGAAFGQAMADPAVDGIVFDVDSPGGVVEGIAELAAEIRGARGVKPIAAVANHTAASAAYWPFAGVDEFVATPSALVGSIGIFTAHDDLTEAMAKVGVKRTVISAGKYKAEGVLGTSLSEDALVAVQGMVDHFYGQMTSDIAKGRGVPVDSVRSGFGEGRIVTADKAVALGMVDRIDSLDNTIRRVARGAVGTSSTAKAEALTRADSSSSDTPAAPASGQPFSERLALASALATDLEEQARKRAELRAADGRELSADTRDGLRALAESLRAIADETDEDSASEPDPGTQAAATGRRVDLEVLEAATRGGYRLPEPALN